MKDIHYGGGGANLTDKEAEILAKKYEIFDTTTIPLVFKEVMNLKVTDIRRAENTGIPHVAFIVSFQNHKDLFFRANLGFKNKEIMLIIEKLASDLAGKAGIPTNKILYANIKRKIVHYDYQIQEVLTGNDPEIIFAGGKDDYDRLSFTLGQQIAKLSSINTEKFGRFDERSALEGKLIGTKDNWLDYLKVDLYNGIEIIEKSKFYNKSKTDLVRRVFDEEIEILNLEKGNLVHYDLADHNLKYNPKTFEISAIFDWEATVSGDSLLDIASAPTWKTLYPREEKLIEGYESLKKLPDNYKEKIDLYRLRTIVWKVIHNIKHNIVTPERLARLDKALAPYQ